MLVSLLLILDILKLIGKKKIPDKISPSKFQKTVYKRFEKFENRKKKKIEDLTKERMEREKEMLKRKWSSRMSWSSETRQIKPIYERFDDVLWRREQWADAQRRRKRDKENKVVMKECSFSPNLMLTSSYNRNAGQGGIKEREQNRPNTSERLIEWGQNRAKRRNKKKCDQVRQQIKRASKTKGRRHSSASIRMSSERLYQEYKLKEAKLNSLREREYKKMFTPKGSLDKGGDLKKMQDRKLRTMQLPPQPKKNIEFIEPRQDQFICEEEFKNSDFNAPTFVGNLSNVKNENSRIAKKKSKGKKNKKGKLKKPRIEKKSPQVPQVGSKVFQEDQKKARDPKTNTKAEKKKRKKGRKSSRPRARSKSRNRASVISVSKGKKSPKKRSRISQVASTAKKATPSRKIKRKSASKPKARSVSKSKKRKLSKPKRKSSQKKPENKSKNPAKSGTKKRKTKGKKPKTKKKSKKEKLRAKLLALDQKIKQYESLNKKILNIEEDIKLCDENLSQKADSVNLRNRGSDRSRSRRQPSGHSRRSRHYLSRSRSRKDLYKSNATLLSASDSLEKLVVMPVQNNNYESTHQKRRKSRGHRLLESSDLDIPTAKRPPNPFNTAENEERRMTTSTLKKNESEPIIAFSPLKNKRLTHDSMRILNATSSDQEFGTFGTEN